MATTAPSLTPTLLETRDIYSSLSLLLALLHRLLCALDPPLPPPLLFLLSRLFTDYSRLKSALCSTYTQLLKDDVSCLVDHMKASCSPSCFIQSELSL